VPGRQATSPSTVRSYYNSKLNISSVLATPPAPRGISYRDAQKRLPAISFKIIWQLPVRLR